MNLHDRDIMERARQEGIELGIQQGISQGISQGTRQKAVDAAVMLVQKYNVTPEDAAKDMDAPLDSVVEALNKVMV